MSETPKLSAAIEKAGNEVDATKMELDASYMRFMAAVKRGTTASLDQATQDAHTALTAWMDAYCALNAVFKRDYRPPSHQG